MNGEYVFLCGVMCAYGLQDAASELLKAAKSADPDLRALAWTMLAQRSEMQTRELVSRFGDGRKPLALAG